jgi:tRNA-dihydrouridine synthase A
MAAFDQRYYGAEEAPRSREQVLQAMMPYIEEQLAKEGGRGLKINSITRHMLGLAQGLKGARQYRQTLSDASKLAAGNPQILLDAFARTTQTQ